MGPDDEATEDPRESGAAAPLAGRPARPPASPGAIWLAAGALVIGAALITSSLALQHGKPRAAAPREDDTSAANAMVISPDNEATAAPDNRPSGPSDPLLTLRGFWALNSDCQRITSLTVMSGQLFASAPDGSIAIGKIQSDDPATGKVVVRQPPGDATTYQVLGDTLLVSSGDGPALIYTRCHDKPAASNAAG